MELINLEGGAAPLISFRTLDLIETAHRLFICAAFFAQLDDDVQNAVYHSISSSPKFVFAEFGGTSRTRDRGALTQILTIRRVLPADLCQAVIERLVILAPLRQVHQS